MQSNQPLKQALKSLYGLDLETKELSVRGWNWGQTEFQGMWCGGMGRCGAWGSFHGNLTCLIVFNTPPGNSLFFHVANKPVLEVPMTEVSNTAMTAKTEVSLEFRLPTTEQVKEDESMGKGDQLVEMRFFVPVAGGGALGDEEDMGVDVDGNLVEGKEPVTAVGDDEEATAAQVWRFQVFPSGHSVDIASSPCCVSTVPLHTSRASIASTRHCTLLHVHTLRVPNTSTAHFTSIEFLRNNQDQGFAWNGGWRGDCAVPRTAVRHSSVSCQWYVCALTPRL